METYPKPSPLTDDDDTGGFFAASKRGAVAVQFCNGCGASLHLPRPYCSSCGSWNVAWRDVSPTATVYSWTVAEHPVHPAFPVPYTVVMVELDDAPGVRLLSYLGGRPELHIGMEMRADFSDVRPDGAVVLQWIPANAPLIQSTNG